MPIQPFQPHYPFTDEKLAQLKQIVPEAFEDGRLNFDTLREVLEPNLDPEGTITDDGERFGLLWPGKKEARRLAAIPSKGTLAPVYGQGLKADGTPDTDGTNDSRNVFIEGENLEVLKIMQKAYAGRVKMIYIDPPYNTGNDFVYDDNFTEPLEHYLRRTGQIDDEGQKLTTNTKADGRFHSKWLSMMYPRLRLARNLLREDGVIFVSIDDNEVHNLRQLMNEVFGEETMLGTIIWQHSLQPKGYTGSYSIHHNYIISFSRSGDTEVGTLERTAEHNKNYKNPDNDPRGDWRTGDVRNSLYRRNLIYEVKTPSGKTIDPPDNGWRYSKVTMAKKIEDREIIFNDDETKLIRKIFLTEQSGRTPESIWFGKDVGTTRDGNTELKKLFEGEPPFDTPKPTLLIQKLIQIVHGLQDEDIVMDFFAGSGTTMDAVLRANKNDQKLKFIGVQMSETIDKSKPSGKNANKIDLSSINEVSIDRVARSIRVNELNVKSGFRCYKLVESQFEESNTATLQSLFDQQSTQKTYTPATLLWEVALNEGFPLDSRVETREVAGQTIQTLTSEFHEFALHCCFDPTVAPAAAPEITLGENDVLVCLDSALDDQTKLRLSDKGLLKTI